MDGRSTGAEFGQPGRDRHKNVGYDYLHVAIDDHSRVAFVQALAGEKGPTCAQFCAMPPTTSPQKASPSNG